MSSGEDDYMSDKFLGGSEKEDIRPGLPKRKQEQRELEIYKKKLKTYQPKRAVREQERREEGLSTSIPAENKGFQMLAKMGYKPGTSLGKSNQGIIEPINVIVKKDTKGVGVKKRVVERNPKVLEKLVGDFKKTISERNSQKDLWKNFRKAQVSCEHLDNNHDIKEPNEVYFWPKEIMDALRKKKSKENKENDDENDSSNDDDDEDDDEGISEEEREYETLVTNENLENIIMYLRIQYFYCIFCAANGADEDDLNSFCPGPFQQDHNDD